MNVIVTGAHGIVGTAIRTHLADRETYEFTYLDVDDRPDVETVVADITDYDDIRTAFDGQDAVIHLAGESSPSASWEDTCRQNVRGTYNVMEAVRDAGVPKVVFASSNHVGGGYVDRSDEERMPGQEISVDHTMQPRPDSYYAVSKLYGEHLGRYYVDYRDAPEQFYAARIGWVLEEEYDHPYGPAEQGVDNDEYERGDEEYEDAVESGRRLWCSRRDCARFFDLALADDTVTYDVFGVRSAGEHQWLDIDHARDVLGYEPLDDADAEERPV